MSPRPLALRPLLVLLLVALASLSSPPASATGGPSTTVAFRFAVCDGNALVAKTTGGDNSMSCILDIRTTTSTGGFDVALAFAWTDGAGPSGVTVGFTNTVVSCPASSNALCGTTALEMRTHDSTYAPDTQTYRVTATRLCSGVPCDPTDQSVLESSLVLLRPSSLTVLCPDRVPVDAVAACTARVVDVGVTGPASTPTSPTQVGWTELLVYIESGGVRVPSTFTYFCNLIPQATANTAECDAGKTLTLGYRYYPYQVAVHWDGDANHGGASALKQLVPDLRYTSTSVDCGGPVYLGSPITCSVAVSDVDVPKMSSPVGDVLVRSPSAASGLHAADDLACELAEDTDATPSTCSFTFFPFSAGTKDLTVTYKATLAHDASSVSTSVSVLRRATSTTLACPPAAVPVQAPIDCTVDVADLTDTAAPSGTATLAVDPALGSFDAASCPLASLAPLHAARCTARFTPAAAALGSTVPLQAAYAGDAYFEPSSGGTGVGALQRGTMTSVDCTPTVLLPLVGAPPQATCAATVTDTTPGTAIAPTGSVDWTRTFPEAFTDAVPLGACTLAATSPFACSVASTLPVGDHMVTAVYAGDAPHVGSAGADLVHVHAQTAIVYDGEHAIVQGANFTAGARLASASDLCALDRAADPFGVAFELDRDPTSGEPGTYRLWAGTHGTVGTDAAGLARLSVPTTGWRAGSYVVTARFLGDPYCDATSALARVLVGQRGQSAAGAGTLLDGSTNTTFRVPANGGSGSTFTMTNGTAWRLSGSLAALVRLPTDTGAACAADGVGTLSFGTPDGPGRVQWTSLGQVRFATLFEDARGRDTSDRWTVQVAHIPRGTGPSVLPGGIDLQALASGNLVCK